MKKYLFILIISTLFGMFAYADIYKIEFDTTKQNNFIINNVTLSDSTSIASILLNTNPVFTKNWDNNHLFVYGSKKLVELPDTLCLKLLNNDEKFTLTYYGNVNSSFGQRWGRTHEGIDFALHMNDYVYAAFDGVVRFAKFTNNGYGNCIIIRHLNGLETLYGHLNNINVIENQFVKSGEIIGLGGSTGRSTGPHLHFETRINDYSFNPEKIIDIKNKKLFFDSFNFSKKELFSEQFYTKPIVLTAGKKSSSKPKTNTKSKNNKKSKKTVDKKIIRKTSVVVTNKTKSQKTSLKSKSRKITTKSSANENNINKKENKKSKNKNLDTKKSKPSPKKTISTKSKSKKSKN